MQINIKLSSRHVINRSPTESWTSTPPARVYINSARAFGSVGARWWCATNDVPCTTMQEATEIRVQHEEAIAWFFFVNKTSRFCQFK